MMKSIKILVALSVFGIMVMGALPNLAFAADTKVESVDACEILNKDKDKLAWEAAGCSNADTDELRTIVQNVLYTIIGILGLVAVIFIIIGGLQYMTSTGDPSRVKKAKDTILYACVGLVVCVLSFAIVNWTISAIKNASKNGDESSEEENNNSGVQQDSFVAP